MTLKNICGKKRVDFMSMSLFTQFQAISLISMTSRPFHVTWGSRAIDILGGRLTCAQKGLICAPLQTCSVEWIWITHVIRSVNWAGITLQPVYTHSRIRLTISAFRKTVKMEKSNLWRRFLDAFFLLHYFSSIRGLCNELLCV